MTSTSSTASLIPFPSESGAHRDWPGDFASENGCHRNVCIACKEPFLGHKRRYVCHQCHSADAAEAKRRTDWLAAHDAPKDWMILTKQEVIAMKAEVINTSWALTRERTLRQRLAAAMLDVTNNRGPWRTSLAAVAEESLALDRELAEMCSTEGAAADKAAL